ncbi:putative toxin, partial [Bacillus thuringiensis]|nr:putative toxin [Bacillus thuringiensis]
LYHLITEIKDVRKVSKTQQFRDYGNTGKPIDLIVSRHSKVSKPLKKLIENSKGTIKVRHGKNKYYTYNK